MSHSMTQSESRPGMTVTDGARQVHDLRLPFDRDLTMHHFHRNEIHPQMFAIFSDPDMEPDEHRHTHCTMRNPRVHFAQNLPLAETPGGVLDLISRRRWLMSCATEKNVNGDAFPPRVVVIPPE